MSVIKDIWDIINGQGRWSLKILFIVIIVLGFLAFSHFSTKRADVAPAISPSVSMPAERNHTKPNRQSGDDINASGNGIAIKQEQNGSINIKK